MGIAVPLRIIYVSQTLFELVLGIASLVTSKEWKCISFGGASQTLAPNSSIYIGTDTPVPGEIWADEVRYLNAASVKDPEVCCWEIREINPLLNMLNTMAKNSLGDFPSVVDAVGDRLK